MQCGIFGKFPSKRDFVVYNLPRPFLTFWETWLQAAVAASRSQMGDAWQQAFLTAPIWRFWLGARLCGISTAGALMPSIDRVGRYFPLTLCACAPEGFTIHPPVVDPMDAWFAPVEEALLKALDDDFAGDAEALVSDLAFPPAEAPLSANTAANGMVVRTLPDGEPPDLLRRMLTEDADDLFGERSYWWTHGGPGHRPQMVACNRMPDPFHFSGFLTGRFDGVPP